LDGRAGMLARSSMKTGSIVSSVEHLLLVNRGE